jgi:Tol biopolymer transport system component
VRNVKEIYETVTQQTRPKPEALERQRVRQVRHLRNQRLGTFAVVAAIVVLAIFAGRASVGGGDRLTPIGPGSSGAGPSVPKVDYVLDLNTGLMTSLPDTILRSLGKTGKGGAGSEYAASPDGSTLAYVAPGEDGTNQIFVAGLEGSGVRQVTHDPVGASWPAWSPDATMIAYEGGGGVRGLFVLDVATGEVTNVSDGALGSGLQFTPDGLSLVYTGGTDRAPLLMTVSIDGGKISLLIGPSGGLQDAGDGSLSPDGSLVTFQGGGFPLPDNPTFHCGPCRLVANADGTGRRVIPGYGANPAGTWSPDGTRIVDLSCRGVENAQSCSPPHGVIVVDATTGNASQILALGVGAIWLDDHTLLIDV